MLTSLDVGFNNLDEEAALSIVRAVRPGDQMASLGLAKCSIGPTGLQRSPSTSRTARRRGGCADVDETDAMGGAWLCVGRGIQSRHPNRRQTTKSSQVKSAWLLRPGGGQLSRSRSASWHVALLVCVANFCGLSVRWMMNEMRTTALLQRLE